MKRYMIFAALCAVSSIVACSKNAVQIDEGLLEPMTLFAGMEDAGAGKISFVEDLGTVTKVAWEADDQLWVRSSKQPAWERGDCFITTAQDISGDGKTARFTGLCRKDGSLCAVYPYQFVNETSTNDKVILNILRARYIRVGDAPKFTNAAVAFQQAGSDKLSMKFLFGAIKFSVTGSGEKFTKMEVVDNRSDWCLWGTCTVVPDYSKSDVKSVSFSNSSSDRNSLCVNINEATLSSTPTEFYFIVPEGSFAAGLRLRVYGTDGQVIKTFTSLSSANVIQRGYVTRMDTVDMSQPEPTIFSGGDGSQTNPYLIMSSADLSLLSAKINDAATYTSFADRYYRQGCDIDMKGVAFTPVGAASDKPFKGHYDAAGRAINNLVTSTVAADGVFAYAQNAQISGVVVNNRVVNGSGDKKGGVVGEAVNCIVKGCRTVASSISGDNCIGGVVGSIISGTVQGCSLEDNSTVTATGMSAGGIVGGTGLKDEDAYTVTVDRCRNSHSSVKGAFYVGGIIGYACPEAGEFVTLSNDGLVYGYLESTEDDGDGAGSGDCCIGGIVGWLRLGGTNHNARVVNCFAYLRSQGLVIGVPASHPGAGDIVGYVSTGTTAFELLNCCGNLYKSDIIVNGSEMSTISDSNRIGAIYGYIAGNSSTIAVKGCCYINDKGLSKMGPDLGASMTVSGNQGYAASTFTDGSTVIAKLNKYVSTYSGPENLCTWCIDANKPYLDWSEK